MAIPNINQNDILEALKYIDENGVPLHNQRTRYELVREDGKKYPPKYVIAVADHLANGWRHRNNDFSWSRSERIFAGARIPH